jgi:hypothetical protein
MLHKRGLALFKQDPNHTAVSGIQSVYRDR